MTGIYRLMYPDSEVCLRKYFQICCRNKKKEKETKDEESEQHGTECGKAELSEEKECGDFV